MINSLINKKILIIIISIIINFTLSYIVSSFKICFIFMDSIGTVWSAVILGPIYGSIVGVFSNIISSMFIEYSNIHFVVINALIGLIVGFTVNKYGFGTRIALFIGIILGIISSAISIPILIILHRGNITNIFDFTIIYLNSRGMDIETAIIVATLSSNILDKIISCLIVAIIYRKKHYKNSIIEYYTIIKNIFDEKKKYNVVVFFVGIILNMVFAYIVLIFKIPFLFMDSIGTILTAVILGPISGALVGIFTSIIFSFFVDYLNIHFAIVNAIIGLISGFMAKKYNFNIKAAILSGLIIGLISSIVAVPISIFLTNGLTFGTIDVFIKSFLNSGRSLIISTTILTLFSSVLDKLLSCVLVYIAIKKIYFFRINEQ